MIINIIEVLTIPAESCTMDGVGFIIVTILRPLPITSNPFPLMGCTGVLCGAILKDAEWPSVVDGVNMSKWGKYE